MDRTLYIFVTSDAPDPYLNSAVHCILSENVVSIVFVDIVDLTERGVDFGASVHDERSSLLSRRVQALLESLSDGRYLYFGHGKRETDLNLEYSAEAVQRLRSVYSNCLQRRVTWSHYNLRYLDLRNEIIRLSRREAEVLFDVTAIKKAYLGDLVALSLTERIGNLFTFDLRQRPDHEHPWRMLIHELRDSNSPGYQYLNMTKTPIFERCFRSILLRGPIIRWAAGGAVALLCTTALAYHFLGERSFVVQLAFIAGSIASLASLFISFFPKR